MTIMYKILMYYFGSPNNFCQDPPLMCCVYAFFKYVWYYISRWWHCNVIKL